jgi:hypothetical protein
MDQFPLTLTIPEEDHVRLMMEHEENDKMPLMRNNTFCTFNSAEER